MYENPFLGEEEQNGGQSLLAAFAGEVTGDFIEIAGVRQTPTTIKIKRVGEYSPSRDAAMLDVLLSTTLDPATYRYLCDIIMRRYIEAIGSSTNKPATAFSKPAPPSSHKKRGKPSNEEESEDKKD